MGEGETGRKLAFGIKRGWRRTFLNIEPRCFLWMFRTSWMNAGEEGDWRKELYLEW